jgi:hypothetical protein
VLLEIHRPEHCHPVGARATLLQHLDGGLDARFAAPRDVGVRCYLLRQARVIDVLHEHGVPPPGREHADGFRRHRPLREPLHRRAGAVSATKYQMVRASLLQ